MRSTDVSSVINEISLDNKLNQCVQQRRRADFSLMLAMLTDDAREFSEFVLPEVNENISPQKDNQALRKQFNLPKEQPLALTSLEEISSFNQGQLVTQLTALRLQDAMAPKPLSFRDDVKHIEKNITDNMSIHVQRRHHNFNQQPKTLAFNANAWLKNVEQAIVSSPLEIA